jgi:hypothetical protein
MRVAQAEHVRIDLLCGADRVDLPQHVGVLAVVAAFA